MENKSEIVWLSKSKIGGVVEMWKTKPEYDEEIDEWLPTAEDEVGSDILDDILGDIVGEGECVRIKITKVEDNE